MKWITHQTGAVLSAVAISLPLPGIGAAWVGAILPDVIDQNISKIGGRNNKQKIFNRIHRGSSHWFGWWLGLMTGAILWPIAPLVRDMLIGFALGSLSHVGMDMLTPQGVPLTPLQKRNKLALPVCKTGKMSEWLFLATIIATAALFLQPEFISALTSLKKYF